MRALDLHRVLTYAGTELHTDGAVLIVRHDGSRMCEQTRATIRSYAPDLVQLLLVSHATADRLLTVMAHGPYLTLDASATLLPTPQEVPTYFVRRTKVAQS